MSMGLRRLAGRRALREEEQAIRRSPQRWRDRLAQHAFGLRMLTTLVVVLAVATVARYQFAARSLEEHAVQQAITSTTAQADSLARVMRTHHDGDHVAEMIQAVLEGMAAGSDVEEVALHRADGSVVAAAGLLHGAAPERAPDDHGHEHGSSGHEDHGGELRSTGHDSHAAAAAAHLREHDHREPMADALATGAPVVVRHEGHAPYQFWVPVQAGDEHLVLHVGQGSGGIERQLAAHRREAAVSGLVIVGLAALAFHLLGGRALARRHRRAVDGSLRDSLTGLGNHRAFQEELHRALARASRTRRPSTCALIDVDHFKSLNDRFGHGHGDGVLVQVARALTGLRAGDAVFRIGGDEFAVVLDDIGPEDARHPIDRVRAEVPGVTLSVGLAAFGADDADDVADLLRRTDTALYAAKQAGRDAVFVYQPHMESTAVFNPAQVQALQDLLQCRSLPIAFQPIWDLTTGTALGYEALARPEARFGFDSPADAFAVARSAGAVPALDRLCRTSALSAFAAAHEQGRLDPSGRLFLNLSPVSLVHDPGLVASLCEEATAAGLATERIVVEITEREPIDVLRLARSIVDLRAAGFSVALDDVGAGNAGLELLRNVPVDLIKIDRDVTVDAMVDGATRGILLAILTFAAQMGSDVIAEGLEDADVLQFVQRFPCGSGTPPLRIRGAQGYFLGRPEIDPAYDRAAVLAALGHVEGAVSRG